jgi:hypothetical protein
MDQCPHQATDVCRVDRLFINENHAAVLTLFFRPGFEQRWNGPSVIRDQRQVLRSADKGYVFNATVIPTGDPGYLTLWPDGETQPVVPTLNAEDGAITCSMAIVPNSDGKTDANASGTTQLVLDTSAYFAP